MPLTIATLLKNMIGAGIVSLPIGLKFATPVAGLLILACIGVMSAVSYWMLGYCCIIWGVDNFRKLWHEALGRKSAWVIDVTILLNGWFTLVGYIMLIGDFTTKSFEGLLGGDNFLARHRILDQWVITFVLLLPLSLSQDLRALAFTSMLGLAVMVYVVVLVLRDSWLNAPPEWDPDIVLYGWSGGTLKAIALYTQAFVAHYNAPKMYAELERPTPFRWLFAVGVTYVFAFFVYGLFAVAGLKRFQTNVQGNVLRNYESDVFVMTAWLGMGFSLAFTYPLIFNSAREALVNLMTPIHDKVLASPRFQELMASPKMRRVGFGNVGRSVSLVNVLGPAPRRGRLSAGKNFVTTLTVVLLTAIVASVCSDISKVNALVGSIMGCLVAYVLPSLLFLRTVLAQANGKLPSALEAPLLGPRRTEPLPPIGPLATRVAIVTASLIMVAGVFFGTLGTVMALRPS